MLEVVERHGRARYRLWRRSGDARRRLSELDDPYRVRGRHLEFYAALAGRAHEGLNGGQPEPWAARLTADLDDLRVAMDSAVAVGDLRALVERTEPIVRFWFERGLSREVHGRLFDAATSPGVPPGERVRGLLAAAALAFANCEPVSCYRSASQAVDAARAAGLRGSLAAGLADRALSGVLAGLSTSEQVDGDVEEALDLARGCGDPETYAYVLQFTGQRCCTVVRSTPGSDCSSRAWRCVRPTTSRSTCRLPTAALRCGLCGPVVSTSHAEMLDLRSSEPTGRASRVGGGRADRPWSCRGPARRFCPGAGVAVRGTGGAGTTRPHGDALRDVDASLAGTVGLRLRRPGSCPGRGCGGRADRPW